MNNWSKNSKSLKKGENFSGNFLIFNIRMNKSNLKEKYAYHVIFQWIEVGFIFEIAQIEIE